MMKLKNQQLICRFWRLAALSLLVLALSACAQAQDTAPWQSEEYIYESQRPCTDEPDAWMNIDGLIQEDAWQDNTWMEYSTAGITYRVTTEFTERGMYIAGEAKDPYVYYHGEYDYQNNTCFEIYIVREDEKEVNSGASQFVRPGRIVRMHIDPKNTVSYTNTPVYTAASVDGTLNTATENEYHETNGWSFEAFISWEAMRLEDRYFAADGIPDTMKLYVKYMMIDGENANRINVPIEPINTEFFRYDTYWHFGRQGLKGDYSSAILNNSPDGPAATDQLTYAVDETGNLTVSSNVNRTQLTWAQGKKSADFMIEGTFTVGELTSSGRFGLGFILYTAPNRTGGYNIFSMNAAELKNNHLLRLSSSSSTDGLQWLTDYSFNDIVKENFESPYGERSVHLKLIKIGGYMYYFVDNEFYKAEFVDQMKGAVNAGLFLNCPGTVSDYRYEDYTGREQELYGEVAEHAYFVELPGVTAYGTVVSDVSVVPKGESLTIEVYPASGYIIGDIFNNGVSFLSRLNGNVYTFTPTENVNITADFYRLDRETEACKVSVSVQDQNGASVVGVTYRLVDEEEKLVYTGKDNGRGVIILYVPRAGEIHTETQQITFSGNYTLSISKDGYVPQTLRIQTGERQEQELVCNLEKFQYGAVVVNGKNATDVDGVFRIDLNSGLYYASAKTDSGSELAYHKDYIADAYVAAVTITSRKASGVPNVPGIAITQGGGTTIKLKISPWGANQLFIECGKVNGRDAEISISGFAHTHSENGGSATFSVARKGENIFIFDADGKLGAVLNSLGVHTVGDHAFVEQANLAGTSANIANFFFPTGSDHAIGILNYYNNGSAETYYDVNWSKDEAAIDRKINEIQFCTMHMTHSDRIASVEFAGAYDETRGFVAGAAAYVYLHSSNTSEAVQSMLLHYADGTSERVFANYNSLTRRSEFELVLSRAVTGIDYEFGKILNVTGTVTMPEDAPAGVTQLVFLDTVSRKQFAVTGNADGSYSADLFAASYDVLATNGGYVSAVRNVDVRSRPVIDLQMEKNPFYIGSATANGKTVTSSGVVDADVTLDALDGTVTVPANNSSMLAVLGNQVYRGTDSFKFSIKVPDLNTLATSGTNPGDTQIGFGFTDGKDWWIFFIKGGENGGKSIGVGIWDSGMGGGDFVWKTSTSPNRVTGNASTRLLSADAVLTIEKTGSELTLYAGEAGRRVKILTASAQGYAFADPYGSVNLNAVLESHIGKLNRFFGEDREFALCLGSFYYNAPVTFEMAIEN